MNWGHHIFKHGSTVDELKKESDFKKTNPNEFLADTFAAFTLMPVLGLRQAFSKRNIKPEEASAVDVYAIACNFGVGYATLVNHLAYGVHMITSVRAKDLLKTSPKEIRANLLSGLDSETLVFADKSWNAPILDTEIGGHVILPSGTEIDGETLEYKATLPTGDLFQAIKVGIARAVNKAAVWATFIRISRKSYVGLAQYRHLEECDD